MFICRSVDSSPNWITLKQSHCFDVVLYNVVIRRFISYIYILDSRAGIRPIDLLHEQEKSAKLRKLSSNSRHVGRQGSM